MRVRAVSIVLIALLALTGCTLPKGFLLPDDGDKGTSKPASLSYKCAECNSVRQGVAPLDVTFRVNDVDVKNSSEVAVLWTIEEVVTGKTDTAFTPLGQPFNYTFPRKGLWQVKATVQEAGVELGPVEFRVDENEQTATFGTGWRDGPKGWCSFALRLQKSLKELSPPYPMEMGFVSLVKVHEPNLEAVRVQLDLPYKTEAYPDFDLLRPSKSPEPYQMHNTFLFDVNEPNEQRIDVNVRCIKPNGLMDQIQFSWML